MTKRSLSTFAVLLFALPAGGSPLNDRIVAVEGKEQTALNAPIAVPYDGPAPNGHVRVMQVYGAEEFPATVEGEHLTFVPDGVPAGKTVSYRVQVYTDERNKVVEIRPGEAPNTLDVFIYDRLLTRFHHGGEKPFLWPLNAPGGAALTRAFPMGTPEDSDDHPHHASLWTGHGDVNGYDFWHLEGTRQRVVKVDHAAGDAYGWIRAEIAWEANDKKTLLTELREYRFYAAPGGLHLIDVTSTFRADQGAVIFGDTKETGIVALRVRDGLRGEAGGTILNSAGQKGEKAAWGQAAAWCGYSGELDGQPLGLAVLSHPSNPGHPPRWHVRDYGLLASNPFGFSGFPGSEGRGEMELAQGAGLTFRHRIVLHRGSAEKAGIAARFDDYARPPKAAWAE